jgi:hypothetical protein
MRETITLTQTQGLEKHLPSHKHRDDRHRHRDERDIYLHNTFTFTYIHRDERDINLHTYIGMKETVTFT